MSPGASQAPAPHALAPGVASARERGAVELVDEGDFRVSGRLRGWLVA